MLTSITMDDGDTGFAVEGTWQTISGAVQPFEGDQHYRAAGDGNSEATWTFDVAPGVYQVSAYWTDYFVKRASNAPFSILDGNEVLHTVQVDQHIDPADDVLVDGIGFEYLGGEVAIRSNQLKVRLTNNANGMVVADAVHVEWVGLLPLEVCDDDEDDPADNTFDATDGWNYLANINAPFGRDQHVALASDGSVAATWTFEDVPAGFYQVSAYWHDVETNRASNAPYTVFDDGRRVRTVKVDQRWDPADDVLVEEPDDPTVQIGFQHLGAPVAIHGPSSVLTVQLTNNTNGKIAADAVCVQWAGDLPPDIVIDNADREFAVVQEESSQGWQNAIDSTDAYAGDYRYYEGGDGSEVARWTWENIVPGIYQVSASWAPDATNGATDAPFSILDDGQLLQTTRVNQQAAPAADVSAEGHAFQYLDTPIAIHGSELAVQITNDANGRVLADAVCLQWLGDVVPADLLDDDPIAFQTEGTWTYLQGDPDAASAFGEDQYVAAAGQGNSKAFWEFNVTPGIYQVSASWMPDATNGATDAPFSVYNHGVPAVILDDGSARVVGKTTVDQRQAPVGDVMIGNHSFEHLGIPVVIHGNDLTVQLSNASSGSVMADAVCIQRLRDLPPWAVINDDDNASFALVDDSSYDWVRTTGNAWPYQGDDWYAHVGDGSMAAVWTFEDVVPGYYQVASLWREGSNRATNAPYTVYDGAVAVGTSRADQTKDPRADVLVDGVAFQFLDDPDDGDDLADIFQIKGTSLTVELTNNATGDFYNSFVFADAVLIQRVPDLDYAAEPLNQRPVAVADSASVDEDGILTGLNVLGNDDDSHGGAAGENNLPLEAYVFDWPIHGTLDLDPSGVYAYDPYDNFKGKDRFTYRAVDSRGGESQPATVTVTINVAIPLVEANEDISYDGGANMYEVEEGETLFVKEKSRGVLGNDRSDRYTRLEAELVSVVTGLTLYKNGTFKYEASLGSTGSVSFSYKLIARPSPAGGDDLLVERDPTQVVINVLPTTNPDPGFEPSSGTPEEIHEHQIKVAEYDREKAIRAEYAKEYQQDFNLWKTFEEGIATQEAEDNQKRRAAQAKLATNLISKDIANWETIQQLTNNRITQDVADVKTHWQTVATNNEAFQAQANIQIVGLEAANRAADLAYLQTLSAADALKRGQYADAAEIERFQSTAAQQLFLTTELGLQQDLESDSQAVQDAYELAVANAETLHEARVADALDFYEDALESARQQKEATVAGLYDGFNTTVTAAENTREAALVAARDGFDNAVAAAQAIFESGPDDRSQTGPLDLSDNPAYLAAVEAAQAAYDAQVTTIDAQYDVIVSPAHDLLLQQIELAHREFDDAADLLIGGYRANLQAAATAYADAVRDALDTYDFVVSGAQVVYEADVRTARNDFENSLHQANTDYDNTVQPAADLFEATISGADGVRQTTVRNAYIAYDDAVYAAEGVLRTQARAKQVALDTKKSAARTTMATTVHAHDKELQTKRRQSQADRDTAVKPVWKAHETKISEEKGDQRDATTAAQQQLYRDLADAQQDHSDTALARELTRMIAEGNARKQQALNAHEANMRLIKAEIQYDKDKKIGPYNVARLAYLEEMKVIQAKFYTDDPGHSLLKVQTDFVEAEQTAATTMAVESARARHRFQVALQEASSEFGRQVANSSLTLDRKVADEGEKQGKANTALTLQHAVKVSQAQTTFTKALAKAQKEFEDALAGLRRNLGFQEAAQGKTLALTLGTAAQTFETKAATALQAYKQTALGARATQADESLAALVVMSDTINSEALDLQSAVQTASLDFQDTLIAAADIRTESGRTAWGTFSTSLAIENADREQDVADARADFVRAAAGATTTWVSIHESARGALHDSIVNARTNGVTEWANDEGTRWAENLLARAEAYESWVQEEGAAQSVFRQLLAAAAEDLTDGQAGAEATLAADEADALPDLIGGVNDSADIFASDRRAALDIVLQDQRHLQQDFFDDLNIASDTRSDDLLAALATFKDSVATADETRTNTDINAVQTRSVQKSANQNGFATALAILGELASKKNAMAGQTLDKALAANAKKHADAMADAGHTWSSAAWGFWKAYADSQIQLNATFSKEAAKLMNGYLVAREGVREDTVNRLLGALVQHAQAVGDADKAFHLKLIEPRLQTALQEAQQFYEDQKSNLDQVRPIRPRTAGENLNDMINGYYDGLTGGLTKDLRNWMGGYWAYSVDETSGFYMAGQIAGVIAQVALSFAAGGACGIAVALRVFTLAIDIYGAARGIYNVARGEGTWGDYLSILPMVSFGVGKLGKAAGKWGCFTGDTLVDVTGELDEVITEVARAGVTTWNSLRWLLLPGAAALLYAAWRRRRREELGESADESDDPYGLDELWQDWMGERRPLTAREQALAALA